MKYESHLWHPCSQMKDYESFQPLKIKKAQGSFIELDNGTKLIDAISSWWCKSLGHAHPQLKQALFDQANQFEHVILANTTNDAIESLSKKLCSFTKTLNKVFYAGDGSCAVEIALKMALHAQQLKGNNNKTQFACMANGYHGETALTLNVSDVGLYKKPYEALMQPVHVIKDVPYVAGRHDPLWGDAEHFYKKTKLQLEKVKDQLAAVIVEPIIQGAGGMLIYSADYLRRLRNWCKANGIYFIADEIMTGIGRTGYPLASQYAGIEADFVCLSKGLTSGYIPLSCVLTRDDIYDLFYDDYESGKAFMHSHTYTGNALAVGVANATLQVMDEDKVYERVRLLEPVLFELMREVSDKTGAIHNIRCLGGMVAADLINPNNIPRLGYQVYQEAIKQGALLRPLGNTIYWLPPLNIKSDVLHQLKNITISSLRASCEKRSDEAIS